MLRTRLAIGLGRIVGRLSRLIGRGGSALPGVVAEKVDPRLLERLIAGMPVVMVTGTNGKTTTTKMLVSILEGAGWAVLTNPTGSNLARGLTASVVEAARDARVEADVAVFEVDEAAVRTIGPRLGPAVLVVTNLHRDQLDRYGELATTADHITAAAAESEILVLNADDPMVAGIAGAREAAWFGAVGDIRAAMPHDAQLHGSGMPQPATPDPDAVVQRVEPDGDGQSIALVLDGERIDVTVAVPGAYNAYNAAAAALAATRLGVEPRDVVDPLGAMSPAFGRGQVVERDGRRVKILLVKNPAGFNQAIRLLASVPHPTPVVVAINDRDADGRDVSWLWDAAVEDLAATEHQFGASGIRAADMALRFKYAGIDAWVEPDLEAALDRAIAATAEGGTVHLVPTYTAMLGLLDILMPGASRAEMWL